MLETVDELVMASVQEKIKKMEAKLDKVLTQSPPEKRETEIVTEDATAAPATAVDDDVTTLQMNASKVQPECSKKLQ